jgi:hypothetical protein
MKRNLGIIVFLLLILYVSYSIKANSKINIDIFPGHTPKNLEKISRGIIILLVVRTSVLIRGLKSLLRT